MNSEHDPILVKLLELYHACSEGERKTKRHNQAEKQALDNLDRYSTLYFEGQILVCFDLSVDSFRTQTNPLSASWGHSKSNYYRISELSSIVDEKYGYVPRKVCFLYEQDERRKGSSEEIQIPRKIST